MTDDTQVVDLLRTATADLPVPHDLLAGGIARGRARRRRRLAGTTLASLAVAGIGAAVVPQLLPGEASQQPPFSSTPSASASAAPAEVGNRVPIAADRGAATLVHLLPTGSISEPSNDPGIEPGEVASRAVYDGGTVEVEVRLFHSKADVEKAKQLGSHLETVREACGFGDHTECTRLPDGSYFDYGTSGEQPPGKSLEEATMQTKATLWTTDGYVVQLFAYNARPISETEVEIVAGEPGMPSDPVLTPEQLKAIATSPDWFRPAP